MTLTERNEKLDMMLNMIDSYKRNGTTPSREVFKEMGNLYIALRDAEVEITDEDEEIVRKEADKKARKALANISQYIERRIEIPDRDISFEELTKLQVKWDNEREGRLNRIDGVDCSCCLNKGVVYFVGKDGAEAMRDCECMPKREIYRAFQAQNFDNKDTLEFFAVKYPWQQIMKDKAIKYTNNLNTWFYVGGQIGSGKTKLCKGIAMEIISKTFEHKSGRVYVQPSSVFDMMLWREDSTKLKAIVNDAPLYEYKMDQLKKVPYLYIDDFLKTGDGREPSAGDINLAMEIIDSRYRSNKKTIISSEYTLDKLREIDEAIAGRIAECCGEYVLNIGKDQEKDQRQQGGMILQ